MPCKATKPCAGRTKLTLVQPGPTHVGTGVFARRRLKSGMVLGEIFGQVCDDHPVDPSYCMELPSGKVLEPSAPLRFVNHSCDPNCELFYWFDEDDPQAVVEDRLWLQTIRDIEPGELVVIDDSGLKSIKPFAQTASRFCIFEYIYFARPDSVVEGTGVYETRKLIGAELARESHVAADVVVPVPDSGVPAAMGYARECGVPFELGIIRNHYVGRTFIEPTDQIRHLGVKLKHSANRAMLEGKRVVLVDDSIVRGTTSKKIVEMVRQAGAAEVHMRISSPPTTHSCFYGIDTPSRRQLIAAQHSIEEMAKLIGVDSLAFISLEGLYRALGQNGRNADKPQFCDACFTGDYAIPLTDWPAEQAHATPELLPGQ